MASTGNTSSEKKRTTQSRRTASQQRTAASKPAASKGTRTSASRSSSKKRKKKKVNSAAFTEAALFIALAVALILFISNFGLAGKVGTFLRQSSSEPSEYLHTYFLWCLSWVR